MIQIHTHTHINHTYKHTKKKTHTHESKWETTDYTDNVMEYNNDTVTDIQEYNYKTDQTEGEPTKRSVNIKKSTINGIMRIEK